MGDLLTAVETVSLRPKAQKTEPLVQEVSTSRKPAQSKQTALRTPEDALDILRSNPDVNNAEQVLYYLSSRQVSSRQEVKNVFHIRIPSPLSAKILNELVSTTIPTFWDSVEDLQASIVECLRSVAGLAAVLARLRFLSSQHETTKQVEQKAKSTQPITQLISVISKLLSSDIFVISIWQDLCNLVENDGKQKLLWKEFLASLTSGKVVSVVAQAEDVTSSTNFNRTRCWLSDGNAYTTWLARNIAIMLREKSSPERDTQTIKAAAQMCGKSFSMGYIARMVETLLTEIYLTSTNRASQGSALLRELQVHEQKQFLFSALKYMAKVLSTTYPVASGTDTKSSDADRQRAGSTALIVALLKGDARIKSNLETWLSDPTLNAAENVAVRRAAVAALASQNSASNDTGVDCVHAVMEKNMKLFGEPLFIKHSPLLQQEACLEVILLTAGYVHRSEPMSLFLTARSSPHLNAVSNRLKASSLRARLLGMIAAMAISELVDKPGSKMTFDSSEMTTPEAKRYLSLITVDDKPGDYSDVLLTFTSQPSASKKSLTLPARSRGVTGSKDKQLSSISKSNPVAPVQTEVQGPKIMELSDDSEEDDDLVPYGKPDSDPEDEDEDPTLITRNKPRLPVYIRDLISMLHDTENYHRHTLAVKNAASLIRRKTSFGKEVKDHAIELASILVGLGDPFELEGFHELRLQALIAVLLCDPVHMAPWFARQVFDGDYSLAQRASTLSVLGLSARELAGYKDEDEELNPSLPSTSFPSKKLPERLHRIYGGEQVSTPVSRIASSLSQSLIEPMALKAADNISGPNILKVRTFSSRMEVEKKRKKIIPNALAKNVAESFFFPLTGRWWQNMQAYGANNVHFQPFLLSTYLKTLAILLHAAGTGTLALPQMTSEFWDLLLSVRNNALNDVSVLEAVLFCFLTLLEVNEDKRRIAEEHSKQLVETQEWVELVFSRSSGGDEEGDRVRMLAASVLMKTREVVEKYERLLVGQFGDY